MNRKVTRFWLLLSCFVVVAACSSPMEEPSVQVQIEKTASTSLNSEEQKSETLRYYENIARMAKWYAEHPGVVHRYKESMQKFRALNGSDDDLSKYIDNPDFYKLANPFLDRMQGLNIEIEDGKQIGFFEMEPTAQKSFLE